MADSTFTTGGGDFLGGGLGGGGLIGGLILGALLRNNGSLLGGDGSGAAAAMMLNPQQAQANMSLMQSIGAVDKSVAVSQAAMEASQATQTGMISNQMSSVAAALTNTVNNDFNATQTSIAGVKDTVNGNAVALMTQLNSIDKSVMQTQNAIALSQGAIQTAITNDGDKTRQLLVQQYEATLNRQLTDANAEIIALQNRQAAADAAQSVTVTTNNNINQMQQQQQQQQQFGQLASLIYSLGQTIRSNNEAINVGSGTLTANPTNTNTNIR